MRGFMKLNKGLPAAAAICALVGVGCASSGDKPPVALSSETDCPRGENLRRVILSDAFEGTHVESATAECRGDWAKVTVTAYNIGHPESRMENIQLSLRKKDGVWSVVGDVPMTEFNKAVCDEMPSDIAEWLQCPVDSFPV